MFTVNLKGCKYYEGVMCMTVEGMRKSDFSVHTEEHLNVSCEEVYFQ